MRTTAVPHRASPVRALTSYTKYGMNPRPFKRPFYRRHGAIFWHRLPLYQDVRTMCAIVHVSISATQETNPS